MTEVNVARWLLHFSNRKLMDTLGGNTQIIPCVGNDLVAEYRAGIYKKWHKEDISTTLFYDYKKTKT